MKLALVVCGVAGALRRPALRVRPPPKRERLGEAMVTRTTGGGEERAARYRTAVLFGALVTQKVAADTLTGWTRARTTYSGATVSMLSEIAKFPVLALAICAFGGGWRRVKPTIQAALTDRPMATGWIAGAYAAQNVLYFAALSYISAASYQVLSQSKLLFTAVLAVTVLREPLSLRQWGALLTLLVGSLLVQVSEMAGGVYLEGGRAALYGGFLTVLGALLSALPNVWYEKLLKTEGEDEWVRNVQVTCWIFLWIAASQIWHALRAGARPFASFARFGAALFGGTGLDGITPAVWLVVGLKALNGILIPATLKYAGNLVYLYAKPTSIVATAFLVSLYTHTLPSPAFALGAALVIASMLAFSQKNKTVPAEDDH
ncbi:hypothetical protein CTAYLR_007345 [Chrysophaeum taylorii]|uniref:Uncharacterized protein n=1 Tax=Chrysophaeum taylorii TaxID=2483200 RepID=A0AAD7UIM0_9STRA|nr:hypothetical protein CTAYLR_007345 [Chrysophaeum taylorii]